MVTMPSLSSDTLCLLKCRMRESLSVILLKTQKGSCVPHTVHFVCGGDD